MENLKLEVGEKVVYCPAITGMKNCGAEGTIISRTLSIRKNGKKKVRAILVRWNKYRKGVSCFRVAGQTSAKSDSWKNISLSDHGAHRFEEPIADLHPLLHCHKCSNRLKRLIVPCYCSFKKR